MNLDELEKLARNAKDQFSLHEFNRHSGPDTVLKLIKVARAAKMFIDNDSDIWTDLIDPLAKTLKELEE